MLWRGGGEARRARNAALAVGALLVASVLVLLFRYTIAALGVLGALAEFGDQLFS